MKGTIRKRGSTYTAIWRDNEGKQHWKAFRLRGEAEKFLPKTVSAVHDGSFRSTEPLRMGDVFDRWLEHNLEVREKTGAIKTSTAKTYRCLLETHLRPTFAQHRSDRLTHAHVGAWAAGVAEKIAAGTLSHQTYNHLLTLLGAVLAWARHPAQSYLAHDPMFGQKRLKLPRKEREYLEPREVAALLAAATPPDDTILTVAAFSGLRRGELFALQWGDVDWGPGRKGGRLFVRRSIYHGRITTPKTEGSFRVVDVPQRVLDSLLAFQLTTPPVGEGYVFRTSHGTPMDPDNFRIRRWPSILEGAGLRQIGLHALRHTYASLLINQGESIKYVSRQLGHSSIAITSDTYGHLFQETSVAAMNRLDKGIAAAKAPRKSRETGGKHGTDHRLSAGAREAEGRSRSRAGRAS